MRGRQIFPQSKCPYRFTHLSQGPPHPPDCTTTEWVSSFSQEKHSPFLCLLPIASSPDLGWVHRNSGQRPSQNRKHSGHEPLNCQLEQEVQSLLGFKPGSRSSHNSPTLLKPTQCGIKSFFSSSSFYWSTFSMVFPPTPYVYNLFHPQSDSLWRPSPSTVRLVWW